MKFVWMWVQAKLRFVVVSISCGFPNGLNWLFSFRVIFQSGPFEFFAWQPPAGMSQKGAQLYFSLLKNKVGLLKTTVGCLGSLINFIFE